MDTSDKDITFDSDGVCSYANYFDSELRSTVEAATDGNRVADLDRLVDSIKLAGRGKPYDCVVGVSGGVDSSYLILQATKLGLRPLAVHFDNGWNSEVAAENIAQIISRLKLDLITSAADPREMRDLQLAFLRASVANCDIPSDHAFPSVAFKAATKYGIKYILSGSNLATESILPPSWGYNAQDLRHIKAIHRRFGKVPLRDYPTLGIFRRHVWYPKIRGIRTVKPLNYMPYIKSEAKRALAAELGWRDYGGKHYESVFTRYFQGYYLPVKFGFDKRRAHLSSLVLAGQLTRERALAELEQPPYDNDLRLQDHNFIAEQLGITAADLDGIIAQAPVDHSAYPNSKAAYGFLLRAKKWLTRNGN